MKRLFINKEIIKSQTLKNKRKFLKLMFLILIIYIFENFKSFFIAFHKRYAIKFIKMFLKNNFNIYNIDFLSSFNNHPNISIIIPLYNCQESIKMSIQSIHEQNFKNYEIILINDYSKDNTSKIINIMKRKDSRIKIINNKRNMGILFSRSIGALNARGKYIFCLDNDDLFYDENLFRNIFSIAESKNFDIVEFKCFYVNKYSIKTKISEIHNSHFNNHPNNLKLMQPELGIFPISKRNNYFWNDYHLWGKAIKTKIYQKAVNILTKKYYSFYNCWTEDISMVFIIFNIAKTFIFVGIYGIIHLDFKHSTTYTLHNSKKLMSEIFLLDIIFKYIQNRDENKIYILQKLISIFQSHYIPFLNKKHIKYLKTIINKILEIKTLNEYDKGLIFGCMNKLKNR